MPDLIDVMIKETNECECTNCRILARRISNAWWAHERNEIPESDLSGFIGDFIAHIIKYCDVEHKPS